MAAPHDITTEAVQTAIDVGREIGPVFTLKPDTKKPSIHGGFYAGKRRAEDICAMASTRPGHLWALATGFASGIVALDADTDEAYEYMRARFGEPHVKTRRGGHWYFKHPGDGKVALTVDIGKGSDELPPGLDRKGDGGYVEIPTPHGTKSWTDGTPDPDDLPVLPEDLRVARSSASGGGDAAPEDGEVNAEAAKAIASEMPASGRHDYAMRVSGTMQRYGVSLADCAATMTAAWSAVKAPVEGIEDAQGIARDTARRLADDAGNVYGRTALDESEPGLFDRLRDAYGWVESREVVTGGKAPDKAGKDDDRRSAADRLYDYARARCEPFKDQYGDPYVLTTAGDVVSLRSANPWLTRVMREIEGRVARREDLKAVADALAAEAADVRELHTRYARHAGNVYVDLKAGRVVEVTPRGWAEMPATEAPVLFRPNGVSLPLPSPVRGGRLDDLAAHLKPCDPASERLRAAWIVLAMLPDASRPILETTGEPGAGKSTDQGTIKRLIDPAAGDLLTLERATFLQNLLFHAVPVFDNLQRIDADTSDDLCRAVTGAAFQRRALYTDEDQIVRSYRRAVAINGVAVPGERADLQDRVLPISLKRGGKRRTDADLRAAFDRAHPALLGALFDALSAALRRFDPHETPPDFRLGDWALYATGVYEHAGWPCLADDLAGVERTRSEAVVDGSPVARAIVRMVASTANFTEWRGEPSELYTECRGMAEDVGDLPIFPRGTNTFAARLSEATQALAERGILVERGRNGRGRWVRITKPGRLVGDDDGDGPSGRPSPSTPDRHQDRHQESRIPVGYSPKGDDGVDTSTDLYGGSLFQVEDEEGGYGHKGTSVQAAEMTVTNDTTVTPRLNIGTHGYPTTPGEYPDDINDLLDRLVMNGWGREVINAALRRRGFSPPPGVERLCVDVEASAVAAGNAEIERQGLEPTPANKAAIGWHAVWAAETRHVVRRIEALRRSGHEHAALALMRRLPAPDEPADDAQEEWAMLNRPFAYHMGERDAYASYAESATGYPMGAAMVSTGYPLPKHMTGPRGVVV